MTLKTSFFNKGIYKSTVKRYQWGAVLYFIILFIFNGMNALMTISNNHYENMDIFETTPLIMRSDYLGVSTIISLLVPTVVALLIFRYIHSKKAAVFTHSIPVKRSANYISSLLAGLTLMAVPIVANGIILLAISAFYPAYFTANACFIWLGVLLFTVFIMFSCSVFSAVITGNSFAAAAVNVLVHCFLMIIASGLSTFGYEFLHGYNDNNTILNTLAENNFFAACFSLGESRYFRADFTVFKTVEFLVVSVVIYALSFVLYKKRRLENAEDVAGFGCLNHIFKYCATFIMTMGAFSILSHTMQETPLYFVITVSIVSIVAYFASEMILKKTLNVFRSYKGYLGFAVGFMALVVVFSLTSFFGYETYVPHREDVESVSVYNYYYGDDGEPSTTDEKLIDYVIGKHRELVSEENISIFNEDDYETRLHIKYTLKGGREVYRIYRVFNTEKNEIMSYMYENEGYKKQCEGVFIEVDSINRVFIYPHHDREKYEGETLTISKEQIEKEDIEEFMAALQKDVMELDYMSLQFDEENKVLGFEIFYIPEDIENAEITTYQYGREVSEKGIHITVTTKFDDTVNWLKEKGYCQQ